MTQHRKTLETIGMHRVELTSPTGKRTLVTRWLTTDQNQWRTAFVIPQPSRPEGFSRQDIHELVETLQSALAEADELEAHLPNHSGPVTNPDR